VNCQYCNLPRATGDTIRLTCLDVFHKACIENYAKTLPEHTAPAGYACITCNTQIIPGDNVVSPVADELRDFLKTQHWAQPPKILNSDNLGNSIPSLDSESFSSLKEREKEREKDTLKKTSKSKDRKDGENNQNNSNNNINNTSHNPGNNNPNQSNLKSQSSGPGVSSRKTQQQTSLLVEDIDEDKYKQKRGTLSRIFWSTFGTNPKSGKPQIHFIKLTLVILVLLGLAYVGFVMTTVVPEED